MRIVAPADRTDAVRDLLVAEPGATHVTVLPGVAVQPAGDVVEAGTTRQAVDGVPAALCGLGIDRAGGGRLEGYVQAIQSAAQPAINLVGIVVAAAAVALLSRRIRSRGRRSRGGGRRLSTG